MSQASIFFYDVKDIYFADEGDTLTVGSTDLSTVMAVRCLVGGVLAASFDMEPFNGLAVIPVGEILKTVNRHNGGIAPVIAIEITQGESVATATASCLFCRRFGDGDSASLYSNWLSIGPDERATYQNTAETLPFLAATNAISQKAMIQIEFIDGSIVTRTFASLAVLDSDGLDVSHSAIQSFARSLMLYSQIKSYSLWIEYVDREGESHTGTPVRFNVNRDRLERISYKFLGGKGAYEYIHASGDLERSIDSTTGTFTTSGIEKELSNDATKTMEQNSGHIASAAEAELWLGFLASKERYVREADGSEKLIIVEESNPSVTDFKIGELTFKWHYSNKNNTIISKVSIPLESFEISGESVADNDSNQLQLGIIYTPSNTTQRGVVWEISQGIEYASISSSGLLSVKEGASGNQVTVIARSSFNSEITATKIITVTWHAAAAATYGLVITSNVEDPTISLSVDGETVEYFDDILIREGSTVVIAVAKSGYGTQTRTIIFSFSNKDQYFELIESLEASISVADQITYAAQDVTYYISDPSNHGWVLDYDGPEAYDIITSGGVRSGNATAETGIISGTGDAVVYLHITANSNPSVRSIQQAPFCFIDNQTGKRTNLYINQDGTSTAEVRVSSISLNKSTLSLQVNGQETLIATVSPSNATNKALYWHSSNTSIAVVDQGGKVTAKGAGTCYIYAKSTDGSAKTAYCTVTVTASNVGVTGVTLNKSSATIQEGGTLQLQANVSPSNATDKRVSWSSSDTSVATVDQNGLVTALSEGVSTITVTTLSGNRTATCQVTVDQSGTVQPGQMSIDDIQVAASAESASVEIDCTGMDLSSLTGGTPSSWIRTVTIDTSGSTPRVRLTFYNNKTSTNARTATITVSGTDTLGSPVTTTFTISQRGYSSSDVPCTSMRIGGSDSIQNSGNSAEYTAAYTPGSTTQSACVWSLTDGNGNAPVNAELITNGNSCTIRVLEGASEQTLILRATNYYNPNVYATRTITATYVAPSSINPSVASVRVHAIDTEDRTPVISATSIQSGSLIVYSVSGFIASASIEGGRLVTTFSANTGDRRSGTVTLKALDLDGFPVTTLIEYTQEGTGASGSEGSLSFAITALNVAQNGGKVEAAFRVMFQNTDITDSTVYGLLYTLKAYDTGGEELWSKGGSLPDKTIAGLSREGENYHIDWRGTIGMAESFRLTVTNTAQSDTYNGAGDDAVD